MGLFGNLGGGLSALAGIIAPFGGPLGAGAAGLGGALQVLDPTEGDEILTPWAARRAREFYDRGGLLWGLDPHAEDIENDLGELIVALNFSFTNATANVFSANLTDFRAEHSRRGQRSDRFNDTGSIMVRRGSFATTLQALGYSKIQNIIPQYGNIGITVDRYNQLAARFAQQWSDHVGPPKFWYLDLRSFDDWARDRWHEHVATPFHHPNAWPFEFEAWMSRWEQDGLPAQYAEFHAQQIAQHAQDTEAWYAQREAQEIERQRQEAEAHLLAQFNEQFQTFIAEQAQSVSVTDPEPVSIAQTVPIQQAQEPTPNVSVPAPPLPPLLGIIEDFASGELTLGTLLGEGASADSSQPDPSNSSKQILLVGAVALAAIVLVR